MLAINQKSSKKFFFFFFFFFFTLLFTNKKTWGGPFFVGAGGDENLKINFLWPYQFKNKVLKKNNTQREMIVTCTLSDVSFVFESVHF